MVVVRLTVALSVLKETLTADSGITVEHETTRCRDSTLQSLFWVTGADTDTIDSLLATDSTVAAATRVAEVGDRSLYRIEFSETSSWPALHDQIIDLDGLVLAATGTDEAWTLRLFLPTRDSLSDFYEYCREAELVPEIGSVSVYEDERPNSDYGLTPPQREVLVAAAEAGYFAVPKNVSLTELSEQLGVSDQAVSERIRRGMRALIENTVEKDVYPGEESASET